MVRDASDELTQRIRSIEAGRVNGTVYCRIKSSYNSLCLDIQGQNTEPGTRVFLFECLGQWNQYFYISEHSQIYALKPKILGEESTLRLVGRPNSNLKIVELVTAKLDMMHPSSWIDNFDLDY